MSEPRHLTIPPEFAGQRLDQSLAELLPEFSRSRLAAWIDADRVRVNDAPARRGRKVWGGESVTVSPEPLPAETSHQAQAMALDVVYEDADILVINKPAGLVTHPGAGNWQGTLLNALLHHSPQVAGLPRAGIVHRLDKDTSGLMVVAKTLEARTRLVADLQARAVRRVYWAVARGVWKSRTGEVDAPMGRHPTQRTRMAVLAAGKPALTYWRVLEQYDACAWVECRLSTGRTHQIRVHLAHIGHALVGDPVYGGRDRGPVIFHRQALHAVRLGLVHPRSGAALEWEAPPPDDFRDLITACGRAHAA
ncbi:MAG TPA: 23S rRNA pseudouridine(1911/1915/1917) synthase RluD [Thiobacillaceae bacterium]|nr:23S rRNA pseudouridine(1911/1915/1917) synthase RluD [Thiobacillaceae bacterium]HNU63022.1 23S rRNA pseudouridine(1911/1915/1917) synthase RluD [Thiobacillaceae bacterium]